MSQSTLYRASALLGVLSGLFLAISAVLPESPLINTIGLLSPVLGIFTLTGIYLHQREQSGTLGAISYFVIILGLALLVSVLSAETSVPSDAETPVPTLLTPPVVGILYLLGVVLFGISLFVTNIFPKLAAVLFVLGFIPLSLGPLFPEVLVLIGGLIAAAGILWLSIALWQTAE